MNIPEGIKEAVEQDNAMLAFNIYYHLTMKDDGLRLTHKQVYLLFEKYTGIDRGGFEDLLVEAETNYSLM